MTREPLDHFDVFNGLKKMHIFDDYTQVTKINRDMIHCFQTETRLYNKKTSYEKNLFRHNVDVQGRM